eukprot:1346306-Pyramimonas_sp.AAC.1
MRRRSVIQCLEENDPALQMGDTVQYTVIEVTSAPPWTSALRLDAFRTLRQRIRRTATPGHPVSRVGVVRIGAVTWRSQGVPSAS